MRDLEKHHFVPKSYDDYSHMFHRPLQTCIFSTDSSVSSLAASRRIALVEQPENILDEGTKDEFQMFIIHLGGEGSMDDDRKSKIMDTVTRVLESGLYVI